MNQQSRLNTGTQAEQQQAAETKSQSEARVFENAEDLLRAEALQTEVPSRIAERLGKSLENLPKPPVSWWRRWLGH